MGTEGEDIYLQFTDMPNNILYKKWLDHKVPNGGYMITFQVDKIGYKMLDLLDKWAKAHITEISDKKEVSVITGFQEDGRVIREEKKLSYWLKILEKS